MLKLTKTVPLDYSLCCMTVTVYHREGLTRRVIQGVHYEFTDTLDRQGGMERAGRGFLLVIPGSDPIAVGDAVVLGEGEQITDWAQLSVPGVQTLGTVQSVKPRYFMGAPCHTEARGV